ncbi:hypothetical protein [Marinitoga lauensis]|uniref:hypothetical protein n=1 Tax=Marinitoga lauensis TaxID=2201189 RepID=UPI001404F777|nr:hypothetical protein [Marinitoga lauensis]
MCIEKEDKVFRFISILGHSKKLHYNAAILNKEFENIELVNNFYERYIKNINIFKEKIIKVNKSLIIPMKTFALHGYIILDLLESDFKPYELELIKTISNIATTFLMSKELYNNQKSF